MGQVEMFSLFITVVVAAFAGARAFFVDLPQIITDPINKIVFRNKCLEDLGCFYTGPPFFHALFRPISLSPYDLEDMKTKFWLYTPSNKNASFDLQRTVESLDDSPFDETLPVKFLTHGYLTDLKVGDSRHRMKDAFLNEGMYNVFIVDWTNSNGRPYPQALANARVVGAQLAQMIKFLQDNRYVDPANVHLIGHSLGSHISGWAGERIPGIGRISGLDPAAPYFGSKENQLRLDTSDANFVDVIHTNAGNIGITEGIGLGIVEPIGHIDFYPNGGTRQPGCKPTLVNVTVAGINITAVGDGEGVTALMAISCDHNQANEFYIESITNKKCTFWGEACSDYDEYLRGQGECRHDSGKGHKVMGYYAQKPSEKLEGSKFYMKTGDAPPYCLPALDASKLP